MDDIKINTCKTLNLIDKVYDLLAMTSDEIDKKLIQNKSSLYTSTLWYGCVNNDLEKAFYCTKEIVGSNVGRIKNKYGNSSKIFYGLRIDLSTKKMSNALIVCLHESMLNDINAGSYTRSDGEKDESKWHYFKINLDEFTTESFIQSVVNTVKENIKS